MSLPEGRLEEITKEVFDLLNVKDPVGLFFGWSSQAYGNLDLRLHEVLESYEDFEVMELAMYLRASYACQQELLTWHLLLQKAIDLSKQRGEDTSDIFYGLV